MIAIKTKLLTNHTNIVKMWHFSDVLMIILPLPKSEMVDIFLISIPALGSKIVSPTSNHVGPDFIS